MEKKLIRIFYPLMLLIVATCFSACSTTPKATKDKTIEIVVHRGANHLAPENTIPSAMAALENGADWVEVDVRRSQDSILYNLHDENLERTTNGKGSILETSSEIINTLDAGSWFGPQFKGTPVPTIAEMLDALKGKAKVFFDVKRGTPIDKLVTLVRLKGFEKESFFWFAEPKMLEEFICIAPEMKVKVNASNIEKLQEWMKVCQPAYVEVETKNITPQFREFCKNNHILIMAAIQNASEEDYKMAIEAQPDLVNLDQPELFIKVLNEMN